MSGEHLLDNLLALNAHFCNSPIFVSCINVHVSDMIVGHICKIDKFHTTRKQKHVSIQISLVFFTYKRTVLYRLFHIWIHNPSTV